MGEKTKLPDLFLMTCLPTCDCIFPEKVVDLNGNKHPETKKNDIYKWFKIFQMK